MRLRDLHFIIITSEVSLHPSVRGEARRKRRRWPIEERKEGRQHMFPIESERSIAVTKGERPAAACATVSESGS